MVLRGPSTLVGVPHIVQDAMRRASSEYAEVERELRADTIEQLLAQELPTAFTLQQRIHRLWLQIDSVVNHTSALVYERQRLIERFTPMRAASEARAGSIAAAPAQARYYSRLAAAPDIRTVCEVGYNVGHSAVVWLLASPTSRLVTFDLFSSALGLASLSFLEARFPGRIEAVRGDSRRELPRAQLSAPCDLVHVDGRHEYRFVLHDVLNLRRLAAPHALFLLDDQCNASACGQPTLYASGPTLAACDLVAAGMLRPRELSYAGARQWATYTAAPLQPDAPDAPPPRGLLPCTPRCTLTWRAASLQRAWEARAVGLVEREQQQQSYQHNQSCGRKSSGWSRARWDGAW